MSFIGGRLLSRWAIVIAATAAGAAPAPAMAPGLPLFDECAAPVPHISLVGTLHRTASRLKSKTGVRILAIGSSSTQGIGASSPSFSYPAQLESALTQRYPGREIRVVNAGVGGETADITLHRMDRELDQNKPDLVLWQVGTNDAMRASMSETAFEGIVESGVRSIERDGRDIILVDQQFFKRAADPARYERFVGILERVAREKHLNLFSRYRVMKFWDAARRGGVETMLAQDGFHMNDRGYACVANLLANYIQDVISTSR
jgi:acyl-CoA thioesterase-1